MPYTTRHWFDFFDLVGRPALKSDPRFADFSSRRAHIDVLYELLASELTRRTSAQWLVDFERADIPAVKMNAVGDLLNDPHLTATSFFRRVEQPGGHFVHLASPIQWRNRDFPDPSPAPALAQNADAILREAGYDDAWIEALAREGVTKQPAA